MPSGGGPLLNSRCPTSRAISKATRTSIKTTARRPRTRAPEPRTPACQIEEKGAIRVCDLFDKPLAISFWFTGGADCLAEQDAFNRASERFEGEVNFLSVNIRDEIDDVRKIAEERDWTVPVGWDRDGAVSNTYRVGLCPTMALALPGGILDDAVIGTDSFTEEALDEELERLVDDSDALKGRSSDLRGCPRAWLGRR